MSTDNDDNDLVEAEARKEGERVRTDLMRGMFGDRDIAAGNGRRNLNSKFLARNEILEKKKKEDEKAQSEAFKRAQEALERHLAELEHLLEEIRQQIKHLQEENIQIQKDIDRNNEKINALKEENERIERLMNRLDNGEFPDAIKKEEEYRKAVEEYRRATGLDPDKIAVRDLLLWQKQRNDAEISGANESNRKLDQEIKDNAARIEELEKRAVEYRKQIDELKAAQGGHDLNRQPQVLEESEEKLAETRQRIKELKEKSRYIDIKQEFTQRSYAGVEDRVVADVFAKKPQVLASTESEVESFMKELAKAQKIENRVERLEQEKKLVSTLSPEAVDQLSMDENTERLFGAEYFKPLEKGAAALSKDASVASVNLLPG